jgi:hypothetical protein
MPQPLVLDVQDEMEARRLGDDVAVLLVEMGEYGIVAEDIHPLPLTEDHANRAVLENEAGFPLKEDRHLLIDHQGFFAPGTKGLRRFNQEVEQRRMAHQTVDLIDGDDARLLVDQTVTPNGAQHLRVGERLQDRIAFQFVEGKHARLDSGAPAARQVDVGRAVEER